MVESSYCNELAHSESLVMANVADIGLDASLIVIPDTVVVDGFEIVVRFPMSTVETATLSVV